jgi:hypothetical protein
MGQQDFQCWRLSRKMIVGAHPTAAAWLSCPK